MFVYLLCITTITSLISSEDVIPALRSLKSLSKNGRKERCRHVARKEVQKYSRRVQSLTDRVLGLQQDVLLMTRQHEREDLERESIRSNLTAHQDMLSRALDSIKELQAEMNEMSVKLQPDYFHTPTGKSATNVVGSGYSARSVAKANDL